MTAMAAMTLPLFLCLAVAAIWAVPATGAVIEMVSEDDFSERVRSTTRSTMVLVCASWKRKACDEARRGFEAASEVPVVSDLDYVFVDAGKIKVVAQAMQVNSFPTVLIFGRYLGGNKRAFFSGHSYTAEAINDFARSTLDRHSNYEDSTAQVAATKARNANNHPHPNPGKVVEIDNEAVFEKYVRDPAKTVLVAFVAPWCSHCATLKPLLDELAEYFKETPKIVIATFNGDENRHLMEHFRVKGFPTLRLFPKGSHAKGRGLLYRGERSYETMQHWVQAHNANVPLDGAEHPFLEDEIEDM